MALLAIGWEAYFLDIEDNMGRHINLSHLVAMNYSYIADTVKNGIGLDTSLDILYYTILYSKMNIIIREDSSSIMKLYSVTPDSHVPGNRVCSGLDIINIMKEELCSFFDTSYITTDREELENAIPCLEVHLDYLFLGMDSLEMDVKKGRMDKDLDVNDLLASYVDTTELNDEEQLSLAHSVLLYKVLPIYNRIMNHLIPYDCIPRQERRYTFGNDVLF